MLDYCRGSGSLVLMLCLRDEQYSKLDTFFSCSNSIIWASLNAIDTSSLSERSTSTGSIMTRILL